MNIKFLSELKSIFDYFVNNSRDLEESGLMRLDQNLIYERIIFLLNNNDVERFSMLIEDLNIILNTIEEKNEATKAFKGKLESLLQFYNYRIVKRRD